MKKIFTIAFFIVYMAGVAFAQTKMVRLTRFEGVSLTGVTASTGFTVEVYPSNKTYAVVEIPEELEKNLIFEVNSAGVVRIGLESNNRGGIRIQRNQTLRAKVYLKELSSLSASSSADIMMMGAFSVDEIQAKASSSGSIDNLDLTVKDRATLSANSSADIRGTIRGNEIRCSANSSADIVLDVQAESANFNVSSSADIRVSGFVENLVVSVSSSGTFKGESLDSKVAVLDASSSGTLNIGKAGTLTANASSSGSIRYVDADVINVRTSSSGSIRKTQ